MPVHVASEAQLHSELERVASQLAPSVEWTQRVDALLRLEGLASGDAAQFAAFPDLLLHTLRDALASQVGGPRCKAAGRERVLPARVSHQQHAVT